MWGGTDCQDGGNHRQQWPKTVIRIHVYAPFEDIQRIQTRSWRRVLRRKRPTLDHVVLDLIQYTVWRWPGIMRGDVVAEVFF